MRIFIGGLSFIAILMVGALIAPQFVDWNKYKPQITTQVEKATGLKVKIDGGLSMSVLPVPHVKIGDLTVVSPNKKEFDNLLKMKSAEVSVELLPLLTKEVKVSSVTLVEPDIRIEILEDGTPSWETEKLKRGAEGNENVSAEESQNQQTQDSSKNKLESVALDKLQIQDGQIIFINHATKSRHEVSNVNTTLKANSLNGPFFADGDLVYNGNKIGIDVETDKLPKEGALPIKATINVPDVGGQVTFNGVAALSGPLDVQGQTSVKTNSIGGLLAVMTGKNDGSLNQDLGIEGLVSASENQIKFDNMKVSTGDFTGNGKFAIQNLQSKNPLLITGDIKSSTVLNLNRFIKTPSSSKPSSEPKQSSEAKKTSSSKDIVPSTLTLPMAINADIKLDVAGLRLNKNNLRGVFVDLNKKDKEIKASFKVSEMPGQAQVAGALGITYASSSQSSKTGQVTYSDPTIKYTVDGSVGQLAAFLSEFAPDVDAKALTKNYNSAQFDLDGTFNGGTIELKESAIKLDDLVVGLNGKYKPAAGSSRASAVIAVTADTIDLDKFSGGSKKSSSGSNAGNPSAMSSSDKADALKPLRNLSLPLDLDFDVSVQNLKTGGKTLSGLRADGEILPNKLTIDTVSVNNYAGAELSLKGAIANLKELSGLDLTGYIKTDDLKSFANTMNIDVSKIPESVNKLEATIEGKGNIDDLSLASNVKALGGSMDASGRAIGVLKTPAFSDLVLRVVHPNANNAIKAISADFKGSDPLNQAIDFYANVNSNGKVYDLTDIKAKLGPSDFTGNLKIDMGSKVTGVSGNINAGKIALDSLMGAKSSSGASSSKGGSTSGGSSSSSSGGGKWSDNPINLSWMNNNNIDVVLSAENLTYGKWNFTNPSTELKIADGSLRVRDLKAGVFGGTATLDTTVNANPVSIDLSSNMSGIDLEKLAGALSNSNRLKARGNVSFNVDVKGTGNTSRALVSSLSGKSNVDGSDIILQGFDLAKIARGLSRDEKLSNSLQSFASGAMESGETQFDTLDGDYDISKGIVKITKMQLDGPSAVIDSTGQADLPKWYIDVDNMVSLKGVEDFEPVNIEIKGSISNPKTFGKNIMQDYIEDKIKRKLGKELPNILGDDVSNTLQQLGIIPQQKKTTPVGDTGVSDVIGTEANDSSAPAEEVAPAQEVEPQPIKEEPKKPEDALKNILGGEDPEDAVNDLIKGLF